MSLHEVLRNDPRLQFFVWDASQRVIKIVARPPWGGQHPDVWRDRRSSDLKRWLAEHHPDVRATLKDIDQAVRDVAYQRAPRPAAFARALANLEGADEGGRESTNRVPIDGSWRCDQRAS